MSVQRFDNFQKSVQRFDNYKLSMMIKKGLLDLSSPRYFLYAWYRLVDVVESVRGPLDTVVNSLAFKLNGIAVRDA